VAELEKIVRFCDGRLRISEIEDWPNAHNGLQLANLGRVSRIGAAVDANLLTIGRAIGEGVDLLLVHHGLFWEGAFPITGIRYRKYRQLLENHIAVYSSHLPLDCHPEFGNNASILRALDLCASHEIVLERRFPVPVAQTQRPRRELLSQLGAHFPKITPLEYGPETVRSVLVCSGGGGAPIATLQRPAFDTVITGEAPRHFFDYAHENGLNAYICGHYATETFGIRNLAQLLADEFHLPWIWLPEDCPL
jgi:dinuclear metal center YbgI/SA1388 family protein